MMDWGILRLVVLVSHVAVGVVGHLGGDAHEPEAHGKMDGIWKDSRNMSIKKLTGVDLRWMTTDPDFVTMEMKARTSGYVAVGFCDNWKGTMQDCDIVVGWVADNGTAYIRDYYAKGNEMPEEDESQDYTLVHADQNEYETRIQFRRRWETNDTKDADLKNRQVRVIYAWHPVDPVSFAHIPPHDRSTRGHTLTSESLYNSQNVGNGAFPFRSIIASSIFIVFVMSCNSNGAV